MRRALRQPRRAGAEYVLAISTPPKEAPSEAHMDRLMEASSERSSGAGTWRDAAPFGSLTAAGALESPLLPGGACPRGRCPHAAVGRA